MSQEYQRRFVVVLGTRPNFVKAGSFFQEAKKYPNILLSIIHTGQHFDDNMSKVFFDEMGIPEPDVKLNIRGTFHTEKIGKMFSALKKHIRQLRPHAVIVFGDVNSTLASAIAASSEDTKLVHIESGLRSHDRRMPEEINRVIVDHLSDLLFVTEEDGMINLALEGVESAKIHHVGNIMINSLESYKKKIDASTIIDELGLKKGQYVVATIHRQENTDDKHLLRNILETLNTIAKKYTVVFPLHPSTAQKAKMYDLEHLLEPFTVIEPLGYFEFVKLVKESRAIITDSGGIQEETTHLGVTCCTIRDNTERPITVELGTNKLFPIQSLNAKDIAEHIEESHPKANIPLWDNKVSKRILDVLITHY